MMKATEFRMGNICRDKLTGQYIRVSDLTEENETVVFAVISRAAFPLPDGWSAEPIPLTPEILGKCGFQFGKTIAKCDEDHVNSKAWSIQVSNLDWLEFQMLKGVQAPAMTPTEWPEWRIVNECSWLRQDFWGQPKFLHQLQNLFFALTGEELTINLFNCETCNTSVNKEGTDCDRCANDGMPEEARLWNERADPNYE